MKSMPRRVLRRDTSRQIQARLTAACCRVTSILFFLAVAAAGMSAPPPVPLANPAEPAPALPPSSYPVSAFAAIGSSFAQSSHLDSLGWDEAQISAFLDGVRAALHGKGYAFDDAAREVSAEMGRRVQENLTRAKQQATEAFAQPGALGQYMKEMRKRFRLQMTESGMGYAIQGGGAGIRPRPGDTIIVSCVVTAADGTTKLPQLSNDHVRVKLADLLPGMMEGFQMMTVNSQAILVLPPALSFGEGEWPEGVDRGRPLVFFLTLHEVLSVETPP